MSIAELHVLTAFIFIVTMIALSPNGVPDRSFAA